VEKHQLDFNVNLIYFIVSADGQFVKAEIANFVSSNKLPLVNIFTRESAPVIFESPIKKQVIGYTSYRFILLIK